MQPWQVILALIVSIKKYEDGRYVDVQMCECANMQMSSGFGKYILVV